MMNGAFDCMSRRVFRYEGTIAQLLGDAVLAFFGAPVAHEDDPERAVRRGARDARRRSTSSRASSSGPRHRLPDPGRHQHRPGDGRQRRQRPALRVHGPRRRGERRGPDADRRRARHRPHHGQTPARLVPATHSTSRTSATSRSRARPSRSTPTGSSVARRRRPPRAASQGSGWTARWSAATRPLDALPRLLAVVRAGRGRVPRSSWASRASARAGCSPSCAGRDRPSTEGDRAVTWVEGALPLVRPNAAVPPAHRPRPVAARHHVRRRGGRGARDARSRARARSSATRGRPMRALLRPPARAAAPARTSAIAAQTRPGRHAGPLRRVDASAPPRPWRRTRPARARLRGHPLGRSRLDRRS